MKKQILFKSALSLVAAAAAGSAFAAATSVLDEDFETFQADYAITNAQYWSADGADESKVAGDSSNKYLDLKTEGSTLTREIDQASTLNTAITGGTLTVDNPAVFSAEVKFVPSDSLVSGLPEGDDATKFAIYAYAPDGGNTTNLVVYHASYVTGEGTLYTNDVLSATVDPETFTKVTVKMFSDPNGGDQLYFKVALDDGEPLVPTLQDADAQETTWFRAVNNEGDSTTKEFSEISFKGTGAVDNLKVDLGEDEVDSWVARLGDPVGGAYEIDDEAELISFQQGVAAGLTTAGTTFKLTGNITLTSAWPGIGIPNGKDIYNTPEFNEGAFCGVFDGQNYTISGFQMVGVAGNPKNNGEGLDYCGFFNSTYQATICNLKIQYAGNLFAVDTTQDTTHESGATFVGVAKDSTLRNLTTLAGTVSCDKGFGGIAGYTTRGTVIDSCTNNVNMTSLKPNKCGGIAMITQNGDGDSPIIRNCQNNGTIAGSGETGGLIGYIGNCGAVISNCESTVAYKLFHAQDATPTVAGIIKGSASVAPSYTYANAHTVSGLNFATVDDNVATFVTDGVLAAGNIYKVLAPSATATFEFTAAGTISFDESLATPTYAITAAAGSGLDTPTSNKVGDVTTWTAVAASSGTSASDGEDNNFTVDAAVVSDFAAAGVSDVTATPTGKSITYAQAYALGLYEIVNNEVVVTDPEATITFEDGVPKVTLNGEANNAYTVTCKLYGSTSLPVDTTGTPIASGAPGDKLADNGASSATAKFYKVVVTIQDK